MSRNGHRSPPSNVADVAACERRDDGDEKGHDGHDDRTDLDVSTAPERAARTRRPAGRSRDRRERRTAPRARIRLSRWRGDDRRERSPRRGRRLCRGACIWLEHLQHRRGRAAAGHGVRRQPRHRGPVHDGSLRHAPAPAGSGREGERPLRRAPRRARRARGHRLLQRGRPDRARARRSPSPPARAIGVGTGLAFVSGSAYVRVQGGSPFAQGLFGGLGLAGGGLALAIVPPVEDAIGWRAPYVTAIVVGAVGLVRCSPARATAPHTDRPDRAGAGGHLPRPAALPARRALRGLARAQHRDRQLGRHAPPPAGGLSKSTAGLVGALTLTLGVVTRPLGGWILHERPAAGPRRRRREPRRRSGRHGGARDREPVPLAVVGAALIGLAAGIPFAPSFTGAALTRPDAPAAAVGFVNGAAAFVDARRHAARRPHVLRCPGDGRLGFALVGACWLVAPRAAAERARSSASRVSYSQRADRVQDDLGGERRVGRVGVLGRVVADPVLAGNEDHRARDALGHAHRVVRGAGVHRHVRLAGLPPRRPRARRRCARRAASPAASAARGTRPSSRGARAASSAKAAAVARDAAVELVDRPADVEREADARADRVDQPRVDLDLAHRADRPLARRRAPAARARGSSRRAAASGRAAGPSASRRRGRRGRSRRRRRARSRRSR